eukprot:TRINITY_DN3015_c0_g3_i1.p2 TRINITY_DN3015_c0_g3~~TRINITY_DN3015_c0_g3_i1.p2  ORF type:complete len:325 (+),score=157.97 TRINITY_DN3015_c0_g3_i1:138-1112(+)
MTADSDNAVPLRNRKYGTDDDELAQKKMALQQLRTQRAKQRNYIEAEKIQLTIDQLQKDMKESKVTQEMRRQQRELDKLYKAKTKAYRKALKERSGAEYKIENEHADRMEQLRMRHREDELQLETTLQRQQRQLEHPIYSCRTKEMQTCELNLSSKLRFNESEALRKTLIKIESSEISALQDSIAERSARSVQRLREKHDIDLKMEEVRRTRALMAMERNIAKNANTTLQRYFNFEKDMHHDHKMELKRMPGFTTYTQPHFIKFKVKKHCTHPNATSRGTQLQSRCDQMEMPSLVDLYSKDLDLYNGPQSLEDIKLPVPMRPIC